MRRAAAAAAAKNIVLSQQSPTRTISSPPPKSEEMASKPREASSSHRRDFDSRKIAAATPSRHSRSNRNGERNEDGRFRRSSCLSYRRIAVTERLLMCVKQLIYLFRSTTTSSLLREKRIQIKTR
ncbi:hypothetical protein Y032_0350g3220 [Ancylostoma ceylanicum]|nr:hypothetical protein Y032_0350g3220 [Ancylostoma ceylanicum]